MEQLIQMLQEKTGISEELAKRTVDITADFLKEKLPTEAGSLIDMALSSQGIGDSIGDSIQDKIGDIAGSFFNKS